MTPNDLKWPNNFTYFAWCKHFVDIKVTWSFLLASYVYSFYKNVVSYVIHFIPLSFLCICMSCFWWNIQVWSWIGYTKENRRKTDCRSGSSISWSTWNSNSLTRQLNVCVVEILYLYAVNIEIIRTLTVLLIFIHRK